MRITNTTAGQITLNYRSGVSVPIPAGGYVIRPSSDLDYLDDTKVTLALFAGGSLVLANDDGSAWSGSALPSVPASPAGPRPLMVMDSAQGVVGFPNGLISASSALTYDAAGRVATRTDGRGSWTLTYDSAGRLLTEVCLDVTRTHSYGTDGRWAGVVEA